MLDEDLNGFGGANKNSVIYDNSNFFYVLLSQNSFQHN